MKKIISLLVLICLASISRAHHFEKDGVYYTITTYNTVEVTYKDMYPDRHLEYADTVVIPDSVEYANNIYHVTGIGNHAFLNCSTLVSITIPESVSYIGSFAFFRCYLIDTITLPNTLETIGVGAFGTCTSLKSVVVPDKISKIEQETFVGCSSLDSVYISHSVDTIGNYAFKDCSNLKSVTCEAIVPPVLGDDVFMSVPVSHATLYVPYESIELYKKADQWKEFFTILPLNQASTDVVVLRNDNLNKNKKIILYQGNIYIVNDSEIYNANGQKIK